MAAIPGAGARTIVSGSAKFVNAKTAASGFSTRCPGADAQPSPQVLAKPSPTSHGNAKIELFEGRTGDGATRLL
jgi:hypothetical protein